MKKLLIICFWILIPKLIGAQNKDSIKSFDLSICEGYGCIATVLTYANFHYENDSFRIVFARGNILKTVIGGNVEFEQFYNSLNNFGYLNMNNFYKSSDISSASGSGALDVFINGQCKKNIKYTTNPDDSSSFMFMHDWLIRKAEKIPSHLYPADLMNVKPWTIDCIYDYTISPYLTIIKLSDLLGICDTTKDLRLQTLCFSSLKFLRDERILDYLSPKIMNPATETNVTNRGYLMLPVLLSAFEAQDSCEKKIAYLKQFLQCSVPGVKIFAANELLFYQMKDGIDYIFAIIDSCENSGKSCSRTYFINLVNIGDSTILQRFVKGYERMSKQYTTNELKNTYLLNEYIVAIKLILDNNKSWSEEDMHEYCGKMNTEQEIRNLDKRLINTGLLLK